MAILAMSGHGRDPRAIRSPTEREDSRLDDAFGMNDILQCPGLRAGLGIESR